MIEGLPFYVNLLFIATVLLTFWLFARIISKKKILWVLALWLLITGVLSFNKFFISFDSFPPRFLLFVIIPLMVIVFSLVSRRGIDFTGKLSLKKLVLLSIVRIPVELTLYFLFLNKQIPELMVFTGRNFDILAGLSAPFIGYYCFEGEEVRKKSLLLIWHFISLALLMNIVINALLSAPFSFQQFGFEQPNRAVFYFPFIWLPTFIVMTVLFSHLVSIRTLIPGRPYENKPANSSMT